MTRAIRSPRASAHSATARTLAALLLAGALGAGGCRPPPERLSVAAVRQPATALFFVAQAAGCVDAERLVVEEHTFDLGRDALVLLRDGRADVAIAFETPVLRAAAADERLRVLTALHTSTRNTRLVARRGAGIERLSDLRGRTISAARGTNADFFVDAILRFGGVPRSEVTVVDLAPDASVAALVDGEVDAAALSDPAALRAERALGRDAVVTTTELYAEFSLLTTREDVVRQRGPALRALLRALACGARAAEARPAQAVAWIRARFPEQSEADLRAELARVRWGLGLGHALLEVLRHEGDWLRTAGHSTDAALDLARLIERQPLEAVDPTAVLLPGETAR